MCLTHKVCGAVCEHFSNENIYLLELKAHDSSLTGGEAWYSLAGLETVLPDVVRNSGQVASRARLARVGDTESLQTLCPHFTSEIADQVTEMGGLLHYGTCNNVALQTLGSE